MKKIISVILITIIALSAFSLAASASAMSLVGWKSFSVKGNMQSGFGWLFQGIYDRTGLQTRFVRLNGNLTQWGSTSVVGTLQAQTRTVVVNRTDVRQGSSATVMWTTNTSRPINTLRSKENFTNTFYTAKLVEPSISAVNVSGSAFFMNGTWNVFQVTTNFTIIMNENGTIVSVHRSQDTDALMTKAYGELNVTSNSNAFNLDIQGVDLLSGTVRTHLITTRRFNLFKITDDAETTVTNADVVSVAKAYGSMPGWGNYDQSLDYNFDYKIDICDLTTATANFNVS